MSLCIIKLEQTDLYIVNSYNKQGSSLVTVNISTIYYYEYYPVTSLEIQKENVYVVYISLNSSSQLCL